MTTLPILLPYGFSPLVNEREVIVAGQPVAKNTAPQEEIINIPQELRISIRKAKKVLQKNPGDSVAIGEIIALHKKFFGMQKESVVSKITGTILKYERDTGDLYIRTSYTNFTDTIISPVDGIVSLCDNKKIVISVEKNVMLGTNATEAAGEGELYFFTESSSANQLFFLDSKVTGKIVVAGNITRESLTKGIALGATGFVGTEILPADIEYVRRKHKEFPVIQVEQESLQHLQAWKNKKIYLDGQTRSIILLQV